MSLDPQLWWYVARASGIVAWALLAGSVLLGLSLSTRALGRRPTPAWLNDLHRALGGLAVTFTGVHLLGIGADSYVEFGLADVLVPFAASWNTAAVAWGVVGLYLLVAVELSSLLRRRVATRWWRRIHVLSFPLYGVATAHLLTAGTDAANPVLLAVVLATIGAVATLTLVRLLSPRRRSAPPGRARPAPVAATSSPGGRR